MGEVSYKVLRNSDFREVNLEVEGSTVLRFAAAYGFRNIQVSIPVGLSWTYGLIAVLIMCLEPGILLLAIQLCCTQHVMYCIVLLHHIPFGEKVPGRARRY